ncbi:MAG: hypothetical protein RSA70_06150 [Clostridia bacterium]
MSSGKREKLPKTGSLSLFIGIVTGKNPALSVVLAVAVAEAAYDYDSDDDDNPSAAVSAEEVVVFT